MKTFSLYTHYKKILADTITPVSIYLKIRDKFPNSILLESSDYHANDNSFSYICFNPIASIQVENEVIHQVFPDGSTKTNNALNISVTERVKTGKITGCWIKRVITPLSSIISLVRISSTFTPYSGQPCYLRLAFALLRPLMCTVF